MGGSIIAFFVYFCSRILVYNLFDLFPHFFSYPWVSLFESVSFILFSADWQSFIELTVSQRILSIRVVATSTENFISYFVIRYICIVTFLIIFFK